MTKKAPVVIFALMALSISACDLAAPDGDAPAPLSSSVFEMNTNLFTNVSAAKQGPHFTNAALRVVPVSLVLGVHLAVPTIVTKAALQAEPVLDDDLWTWNSMIVYQPTSQAVNFQLSANTRGLNTDWSMNVSYFDPGSSETYDDFELYSAQTRANGTEGSWGLFYLIDGVRTNVLNAEFTNSSPSLKSVTFSVPVSADNNAGDTVRYDVAESTRIFTWDRIGGSETVIAWNEQTGEGSIIDPNYNNGEPACWDSSQADVECPS